MQQRAAEKMDVQDMGVCSFRGETAQTMKPEAGSFSRPEMRVRRSMFANWTGRIARLLRQAGSTSGRTMRHLETLSLGRRHLLYLVECHGERFLIAAAGDSISAPVPVYSETPTPPGTTEGEIR